MMICPVGIPSVSIVTPVKNRFSLLLETMDSVRSQTFKKWEHIIVDDGSDDGTREELAVRSQSDCRVRYMERAGIKSGANVCRNQGLEAARADLIVFLDSDDLLDPDCLARRVLFMERNLDLDLAVGRTGVFVRTPGDLNRELDPDMIGDDLLRFLLFEVPWQTTAPIWRRKALEDLGGFDESLLSWQDIDLHVRAIAMGLRYLRLPFVDHHMRWQEHPDKISTQALRSLSHLEAARPLLIKFEHIVRQGPGMNWVRQRALCSLYFFVAERLVDLGHLAEALECWRLILGRRLGPATLHIPGALLLRLKAKGSPARGFAERVVHKWKGWARLRTNPELVVRVREQ